MIEPVPTRDDTDIDPAGPSPAAVPVPRLRLRLVYPGGAMLGPGKADLLEGIRETGSIAAAGRRMGMSYKRAWSLVETMNAMFAAPLVETSRGGAAGGLDAGDGDRPFPAPWRTAGSARGVLVGGRATDAGHRPGLC